MTDLIETLNGTGPFGGEGFRHAPFSEPGCLLFVKLRQFPGRERQHVTVDTTQLVWQPGSIAGVSEKALYQQSEFEDTMRLERWDPRTDLGTITRETGAELFVLDGEFADDDATCTRGCWMRLPAGYEHHPRTTGGCTLYVKTACLSYLRSAA